MEEKVAKVTKFSHNIFFLKPFLSKTISAFKVICADWSSVSTLHVFDKCTKTLTSQKVVKGTIPPKFKN